MKYTIDEPFETAVLTPEEVAEQLLDCNAFELASDETLGEVEMDGHLLVIHINWNDPMDKRVDGYPKRDEEFDIGDIRSYFTAADYYTWAKDEDGNDVLMCFGC